MKRLLVVLLALVLATGLVEAPVGAASPRACPTGWGSLEEATGPSTSPHSFVSDGRVGRHACYDRFVVEVDGPAAGYVVHYVHRLRDLASNEIIPLPGGGKIEILVRAPGISSEGHPQIFGDLAGFQTFRSARYGGTFEGLTQLGLGVRARLPFRVFRLSGRIVIDVAHHW
jgi:hypothetical protein